MPARGSLRDPETGLVDALRALSQETQVRPDRRFASALRERILAEAVTSEAEDADAFQRALEGRPARADLAALASFAGALSQAARTQTAPASLKGGIRTRITGERTADIVPLHVARQVSRPASRLGRRLSRRLAVAAAMSGMLVSSISVAFAASANDTPADSLYGVKRFGERAQTWFLSGPDEGVRRLRFADARVDETETMLDRTVQEAGPFERAFRDLGSELSLATDLILGDGTGEAAGDGVPALADWISRNHGRVEQFADEVPQGARPLAAEVLTMVEETARRAEPFVGRCVLCDDEAELPEQQPSVGPDKSCPNCAPSAGIGTAGPGVLPSPGGEVTEIPVPRRPSEPRTPPSPPKVFEPLPPPDRVPDLPGRIDDDLEGPVGQLTGGLVGGL